jgi:endo-1,4-beta-mannosidase
MKFIDGKFFSLNGRKRYLLGINYLSSKWGHSSKWWQNFDLDEIARDLSDMQKLGFKAVRIPLPHNLMPKAGIIDEAILKNLDAFIAIARQKKLSVIINLFMTGRISETDWLTNDKAYTDQKTIDYEVQCVQAVTGRYKDDDTVIAYDVCNEPWWMFGFPPAKTGNRREVCSDWFRKFTAGVRVLNPGKAITLGIDHSGVVFDVGGDVDALMDCVDLMSTHGYSRYAIGGFTLDSVNSLRDTYYCSFIHRRSSIKEMPSGCLEFGNSSQYMSEAKLAGHFRVLLWSLLVNGSTSFFPWNFIDFAESAAGHYDDNNLHELYFGVLRQDRSIKPHGNEIRKFSEVIEKIDPERFSLESPDTAVYVPDSYYTSLNYKGLCLFNAYCCAKQAGMNVGCIRSKDDWSKIRVLISPTGSLGLSEMEKIKRFVEQGGILIMSADGMYNNLFHIKEVLGVEMEEVNMVLSDIILKPAEAWMGLQADERFCFSAASVKGHTQTMVTPKNAQRILSDEQGHAVVTGNSYGKGFCIFTAFPAEFSLAHTPDAPQTIPWWKLYRAAKTIAKVQYAIEADHPYIETGILKGKDSSIGIFINHENIPVTAPVRTDFTCRKTEDLVRGNTAGQLTQISLEPNQVSVIRFDHAGI